MSRSRAIAIASIATVVAACSFTTSTDGLMSSGVGTTGTNEGGASDALSATDVEQNVPPPTSCKADATQCVPAAPAGWTGPLQIYDGSPAPTPLVCPSPQLTAIAATTDPENPAAECAPCSCAASDVTCPSAVPMQSYSDSSCTNSTGCIAQTVPANTCVPHDENCSGSVRFTAPIVTATCTPSGGAPTVVAPKWKRIVLGCRAPTSFVQRVDCSADQVCVPRPSAPFEPKVCVLQSGDVGCPASPYHGKRLLHEAFDDTRSCSPCACNVPSTPCKGGLAYTGPSSGCAPDNETTPFGSCFAIATVKGSNWRVAAQPPVVVCAQSGGAQIGALIPKTPITVCCL